MSTASGHAPVHGADLVGSRRQVLVGGLMLAAGGIALARRPRLSRAFIGEAKLADLVPRQLSGWSFATNSGLVLPPPDELRDRLYSQLLTRVYTMGDAAVMLLIAYSRAQDGVIQVHRPEVCYPASGYALRRNNAWQLPLTDALVVPGRFIVAQSETRSEQLAYWTRVGDSFPTRWADQRLAVAEQNIAGCIPDGVLVRVSVAGTQAAQPIIASFCKALYQGVGARMRRVLVGDIG